MPVLALASSCSACWQVSRSSESNPRLHAPSKPNYISASVNNRMSSIHLNPYGAVVDSDNPLQILQDGGASRPRQTANRTPPRNLRTTHPIKSPKSFAISASSSKKKRLSFARAKHIAPRLAAVLKAWWNRIQMPLFLQIHCTVWLMGSSAMDLFDPCSLPHVETPPLPPRAPRPAIPLFFSAQFFKQLVLHIGAGALLCFCVIQLIARLVDRQPRVFCSNHQQGRSTSRQTQKCVLCTRWHTPIRGVWINMSGYSIWLQSTCQELCCSLSELC